MPSPFKTPRGKAVYLDTYEAALNLWPVSYEEMQIPSRFGMTHVVVSGPKDAPPLVLLHGYMATLLMWSPNIVDFSMEFRVYAIDTMGQPSKSIPNEPVRDAADYVAWLNMTLDGLHLDRISLLGMSFGGWLALKYTLAASERVQKLVLLSPGGFLSIAKQFSLRGMLMVFFPTRFTVNTFMHWLGFNLSAPDAQLVCNLMYLGMKHFQMAQETLRVVPNPLSDQELRGIHAPVLLLMGEHDVIYHSETALARARLLIPNFEGDLVPRTSHDMCFSQNRIVNARILEFLLDNRRNSAY